MAKRLLILSSLAAALFAWQFAGAEEEKFAAKCPVSGRPAKKTSSVKYLGKDVYFCCDNCPNAFKKDTKKFAAKAHHQLLQTKQIVQVACPFSGQKINPEATVEVDGVKVAFCCNNCKGKAEKADDQIALIFTKIDKGFTLQTKCPVSGKPIKADKVVKYKGKNVYFCCPGCPAAFKADPDKFLSKLPQFQTKEDKS